MEVQVKCSECGDWNDQVCDDMTCSSCIKELKEERDDLNKKIDDLGEEIAGLQQQIRELS